jgi:Flp pilus assembly protein TadD
MGETWDSGETLKAAIAQARALAQRGELSAAVGVLERAAATIEDPTPAIFEIGNLTKAAGLLDQAEAAFRQVMDQQPGSVEAATNLANVLTLKGQTEAATVILTRIASLAPGLVQVEISLADALFRGNRIVEALTRYEDLIDTHPDLPAAHANRGEALARLGRHDEAVDALDRAAALASDSPEILRNRAFSKLARGDLLGGFADYEARLDPSLPDAPVRRNLAAPRWDGMSPLAGPLLVVAEQGLGDEIRFGAALPRLVERVPSVIVECDPRLAPLFAASLPGVRVVPYDRRRDGARAVFDYAHLDGTPAAWIEAGSLPRALSLPGAVPIATMGYLSVPESRSNLIRARMKAEAGERALVGLCWGSGAAEHARARYYPPLDAWRPVLTGVDATFVDLQYVSSAEDRAILAAMSHAEFIATDDIDKRNDLVAAACLAAAMDAVVGVSSSVAAMAAAVGTPTVEITPERTWVPQINGRDAWLGSIISAYPDQPDDWPQAMRRGLAHLRDILEYV